MRIDGLNKYLQLQPLASSLSHGTEIYNSLEKPPSDFLCMLLLLLVLLFFEILSIALS